MVTSTTATQRQLLFEDDVPPGGPGTAARAACRRVACSWRSMLGGETPITSAAPITLAAMERRPLCARPGCQGQTAAWLTYDYAGQRVWLDDAPSARRGTSGRCAPATPAACGPRRAGRRWTAGWPSALVRAACHPGVMSRAGGSRLR